MMNERSQQPQQQQQQPPQQQPQPQQQQFTRPPQQQQQQNLQQTHQFTRPQQSQQQIQPTSKPPLYPTSSFNGLKENILNKITRDTGLSTAMTNINKITVPLNTEDDSLSVSSINSKARVSVT